MGQARSGKISVVRIVLGVLAIIAVGIAWRVWAPTAQIAAKVAAGNAWEGAERELRASFLDAVKRSFAIVDIPPSVHEDIATCLTRGAISFLNTTDCRYEYNAATEDKANHLSGQEACMNAAGYPAKMVGVQLACAREHLPKGWEMWESAIREDIERANPKDAAIDDRKALAACQARALVAHLNEFKCPSLVAEAASLEEIRPPTSTCVATPEAQQKRQIGFTDCIVKHTTWEAGRAELLVAFRQEVDTNLEGLAVSDEVKADIANCGLGQAIASLDKSGCRYTYNKATTTAAEHEEAQSACVAKTTYSQDLPKIRIACLVKHLPNDWEIMRPLLTKGIRALIAGQVTADQLDQATACILDGAIALFTAEKCAVVNTDATSVDSLLLGEEACVKSRNLGPPIQLLLRKCTGGAPQLVPPPAP